MTDDILGDARNFKAGTVGARRLGPPQRLTPHPAPPSRPQADQAQAASADAPVLEPRAKPAAGRPERGLSAAMNAHLERFELRMPNKRKGGSIIGLAWFIMAFALPVLLGTVYYGLIASKQYVSEFHFTVRDPLPDGAAVPGSNGQSDSLVAFLGRTSSGSGSADTLDNYTVVDYIRSEQAARDLDERLNLKTVFAHRGIDPLSRYDGSKASEKLGAYWKRMVWASYDPATGLASVKVRAFNPADAFAIATNLIDLSDGVVNSIGRRSRADSLQVAQREVDAAQARMTEIQRRVTALRNQLGTIDPKTDAVSGNVDLANTLRASLTQQESQLAYLSSQLSNRNAPQIAEVRAQLNATQSQLARVDSQVNHSQTGNVALTAAVGEFEQLDSERKAVEGALFQSLERLQEASVGADSQRLYLATYVKPALAQSSIYPNRLESIGILAFCCLLIWSIGVLIGKSVLDHVR